MNDHVVIRAGYPIRAHTQNTQLVLKRTQWILNAPLYNCYTVNSVHTYEWIF